MTKTAVIESVKGKVDRLIAENRNLRGELDKAIGQRDKLKVQNRDLEQQIARLDKRIEVLELRESMAGGSADTKVARARVNRLMREVDKCIALLNK